MIWTRALAHTGDVMDRMILAIASFIFIASSAVCSASDSSNTAGLAPGHAYVEQPAANSTDTHSELSE